MLNKKYEQTIQLFIPPSACHLPCLFHGTSQETLHTDLVSNKLEPVLSGTTYIAYHLMFVMEPVPPVIMTSSL